jgi:predicted HTH domain antitoxin
MPRLEIDCPDELLTPAGQTKARLEKLAQEAFLVRLYALGELSSGRAAEILRVPRRAFLDVLGRYGVDVFDDNIDLQAEAPRGR